MNSIQPIRLMGRTALIATMATASAFAVDVSYNTIGTFTGGSSTLTGPGGLAITYTNLTDAIVTAPTATNAQFGLFSVTGPASSLDPVNTNFSLTVQQTSPGAGTETLTDTFAGSIDTGSSNIRLIFTGGSGSGGPPVLSSDPITGAPAYTFSFGKIVYWVDEITPINPSTTGGGISTIEGAIDASAVAPEPEFFGLTGGVFAGLAVMARRRRRQAGGSQSFERA